LKPSEHPAWPALTDAQRRAVNRVWDETVVPALERAERLERDAQAALLAAQDARDSARHHATT
jgi:hypothetical protein